MIKRFLLILIALLFSSIFFCTHTLAVDLDSLSRAELRAFCCPLFQTDKVNWVLNHDNLQNPYPHCEPQPNISSRCDEGEIWCGINSIYECCQRTRCEELIPHEPICGNGEIEEGEYCDTNGNVGCLENETCDSCYVCVPNNVDLDIDPPPPPPPPDEPPPEELPPPEEVQPPLPPPPDLCGNGVVDEGEFCDTNGNVGCEPNESCDSCQVCVPPSCGNFIVEPANNENCEPPGALDQCGEFHHCNENCRCVPTGIL